MGVDAGGVTREYFNLLMKRLQVSVTGSINLFEGKNGHLVPVHNYDVLSGGLFILAGKMILHSIMNQCTGLRGLSPAVLLYLISGNRDSCVEHITVEDVPDPVLQDQLNKLTDCENEELVLFTLPDSPHNISDLLISAGFPHVNILPQNRQMAFECCLLFEVITKRVPALDDMRRGLQSVKVMGMTLLDLVAKMPLIQDRLFPEVAAEVISLSQLAPYIDYKSNCDNVTFRETCLLFERYLNDLSGRDCTTDQETLSDLVLFWTADASIPADTSMKLTVSFLAKHESKRLPEANTCPRVLLLPTVHNTYTSFRNAMDSALECGKYGFGKM